MVSRGSKWKILVDNVEDNGEHKKRCDREVVDAKTTLMVFAI